MQIINNTKRYSESNGYNLNRIVYYVAVVETGSFTAAADRLGITKAVVSQQVAKLEEAFNTKLLVRSTRRIKTTEEGQAFYYRCAFILKEAENAFGVLSESSVEPTGVLRMTVPFDYGVSTVIPAVTKFSEKYPSCSVEVDFSDGIQDINFSNFDVAIRVGWLMDQSLQARKLGEFTQCLVASPKLAKKIGKINSPLELVNYPMIGNTALREPLKLSFSQSGKTPLVVSMKASLLFNATLAVKEAAVAGTGLSVLPDYVVKDDLATGRLISILPEWHLPKGDIYIVYPIINYRPAKVKAFVELMMDLLKVQ